MIDINQSSNYFVFYKSPKYFGLYKLNFSSSSICKLNKEILGMIFELLDVDTLCIVAKVII